MRGPKGLPLLGNVASMLGSPVDFMTAVSARFDGLAEVRVPGKTIWVVSHPQAVKRVLQDRNKNYVRGGALELIEPVFGRGLATSDGEHWMKHRRMMQPAFHKDRMQRLVTEMDSEISDAVAELPAACDLRDTMVKITQRVVVRTMFGTGLGADAQRWCDALLTIENHIANHAFDMVPRPSWLPTRGNLAYKRAIKVLDTLVYRLMKRDAQNGDLLDLLQSATDPDAPGEKMPPEDIRDEVMTIFIAGHETTANTLAFALYRLGRDPEALAKVRAEVRAASDASPAALPYTRAVIDETLRLYPPAWIFAREAVEDDTIFDQTIKKGSLVLLCPYATHRRTDVFPDPETFRPERFLGQNERPPFSYFPFGGGPHLCIGNHFAMAEALLVLARLFRRFDVRVGAERELKPVPAMTLGLNEHVTMQLSAA